MTTPKQNKIMYGGIAAQYKDALTELRVKDILSKKEENKKETLPMYMRNPVFLILLKKQKKFRIYVENLAKRVTMKHISTDDFILAMRNEIKRLFDGVRNGGTFSITDGMVKEIQNTVGDISYNYFLENPKLGIGHALEISSILNTYVEDWIQGLNTKGKKESIGEVKKDKRNLPIFEGRDDSLAGVPKEIKEKIEKRLDEMGISRYDTPQIRKLLSSVGLSWENVLESLKNGNVPPILQQFL